MRKLMYRLQYPLVFCLTFFVVYYAGKIALAGLPDNLLSLGKVQKMKVLNVFPQGWAYFTRDPREEDIYLYMYRNGKVVELERQNGSVESIFGLKRVSRYSGIEVAHLMSKVKEDDWMKIRYDILAGADSIKKIYQQRVLQIENTYTKPTLCGILVVQKRAPVPYAWYNSEKKANVTSQIVLLNVDCSKN